MRISDWSSDVCSSDLRGPGGGGASPEWDQIDNRQRGADQCGGTAGADRQGAAADARVRAVGVADRARGETRLFHRGAMGTKRAADGGRDPGRGRDRSRHGLLRGAVLPPERYEERRVGNEWVLTWSFRWSPDH